MLKKTLIAATALSAVALGAASPASAHYKGHYNFSWYAGYPSWSYSSCHYEKYPGTYIAENQGFHSVRAHAC